jgi:hypothetical protein
MGSQWAQTHCVNNMLTYMAPFGGTDNRETILRCEMLAAYTPTTPQLKTHCTQSHILEEAESYLVRLATDAFDISPRARTLLTLVNAVLRHLPQGAEIKYDSIAPSMRECMRSMNEGREWRRNGKHV